MKLLFYGICSSCRNWVRFCSICRRSGRGQSVRLSESTVILVGHKSPKTDVNKRLIKRYNPRATRVTLKTGFDRKLDNLFGQIRSNTRKTSKMTGTAQAGTGQKPAAANERHPVGPHPRCAAPLPADNTGPTSEKAGQEAVFPSGTSIFPIQFHFVEHKHSIFRPKKQIFFRI